ncbi:hypothetical protein FACS189493_1060 [Spirochaetia bacterium]|nr:hypothetical protein FACS189493_1060 [Spirochaetia bacterium]
MKKCLWGLLFSAFLLVPLSAQDATLWDTTLPLPPFGDVAPPTGGPAGGAFPAEVKDFYYHVTSDRGAADAAAMLRELELRFTAFNRLFRFDPSGLEGPLRVRVINDKEFYDSYVTARLGRPRDGAVYLHYNQKDRRELVIHRGSPQEGQAVPHQAFVQFLQAFVSNPPGWLREGFAIYFNTLKYDAAAVELSFEENLVWLDTVKQLENVPLESILLADPLRLPRYFQGLAWSLVSFFLNAPNEDYFRTLVEVFVVLRDDAVEEANAAAAVKRISLWTDMETFTTDYRAYIQSRKTFADLLREGQRAYAEKDTDTAEQRFLAAISLKPGESTPYYYLGLLAYDTQDFDQAETHYQAALRRGADEALLRYAQGLNALSAGRTDQGIQYLEQAALASPERYKTRAEELIQRFQ